MQRYIAFIIIIFGLFAFWFYESNFDTQNICENYYQTNLKSIIKDNPKKAIVNAEKWRNACNTELLKNKESKSDKDFNKSCRMIDKAAMSTLTYVSVVKRNTEDKTLAPNALKETIKNIQPYANCVEYNVYNGMLNQSLKKIQ